jgi:GNAT superfamily N-acetyltransferase
VIRPLDPAEDWAKVTGLFARSADYVWLERGEAPSEALTREFFESALPGADLSQMLKLGLFEGDRLQGIVDMGFGFPEAGDAYLGLLQLAEEARGCGLGAAFLRHVEAEARARGAPRLYLAVLDQNPRGRGFWEREGFRVALANRPVRLGQKDHIATRMAKAL